MHRVSLARAFALVAVLAVSACSGGLVGTIVATRDRQGDIALRGGHYDEAAQAYKLALSLAPGDAHARSGLAQVQLVLAEEEFQHSRFDDALGSLAFAEKYDPQSVRLQQLRAEIEDARTKRQIVISNYPAYRETGARIRHSYAQLKEINAAIETSLKRFDYTYDSANLAVAVRQSYELTDELQRLTSRLIGFRQAVESGSAGRPNAAPSGAGSLLPLP